MRTINNHMSRLGRASQAVELLSTVWNAMTIWITSHLYWTYRQAGKPRHAMPIWNFVSAHRLYNFFVSCLEDKNKGQASARRRRATLVWIKRQENQITKIKSIKKYKFSGRVRSVHAQIYIDSGYQLYWYVQNIIQSFFSTSLFSQSVDSYFRR